MTEYCNHHPTRPAHWTCSKCDQMLCNACVLKREKGYVRGEYIYLCPNCIVEARWIAAANAIEPFWNRLHKIFMYPFSLQPLILIFTIAIIGVMFSTPGFFSGILKLATAVALVKYAFAALRSTARGNLKPPKVSADLITGDVAPVVKQMLIYFTVGILFVMIVFKVGPLFGGLFLIFAGVFIPAMIIILAATDSFFNAINPLLFTQLAIRIGWGYAVMLLFYLLLGGAPALLAQFFMKFLPQGLSVFLIGFAQSYYSIVAYHLMGYMMLQYNQEVGYKVNVEDFDDASGENDAGVTETVAAGIAGQVGFLVKEGKFDEAIELIKKDSEINGFTDSTLSGHYFKLLKMKKMIPEMIEHGFTHLQLLVKENKKKESCEAFADCVSNDAGFTPSPIALFKIGGWLNESGKTKESLSAFSRLIKANPDDPLVPKAYFRSAQIYQDRVMNTEKAKKIIDVLLRKFPDHEIIPQVKRYMETIG